MSLQSPLGRVRGLGSAKEGVHHWWLQKITAIALIPLSLWFVISVIGLIGADYAQLRAFLGNPGNATMMILMVAVSCWHGALGIQVVAEDYVHSEGMKLLTIVGSKLALGFLATFLVVSILKAGFGG